MQLLGGKSSAYHAHSARSMHTTDSLLNPGAKRSLLLGAAVRQGAAEALLRTFRARSTFHEEVVRYRQAPGIGIVSVDGPSEMPTTVGKPSRGLTRPDMPHFGWPPPVTRCMG